MGKLPRFDLAKPYLKFSNTEVGKRIADAIYELNQARMGAFESVNGRAEALQGEF